MITNIPFHSFPFLFFFFFCMWLLQCTILPSSFLASATEGQFSQSCQYTRRKRKAKLTPSRLWTRRNWEIIFGRAVPGGLPCVHKEPPKTKTKRKEGRMNFPVAPFIFLPVAKPTGHRTESVVVVVVVVEVTLSSMKQQQEQQQNCFKLRRRRSLNGPYPCFLPPLRCLPSFRGKSRDGKVAFVAVAEFEFEFEWQKPSYFVQGGTLGNKMPSSFFQIPIFHTSYRFPKNPRGNCLFAAGRESMKKVFFLLKKARGFFSRIDAGKQWHGLDFEQKMLRMWRGDEEKTRTGPIH